MNSEKSVVGVPFWVGVVLAVIPCTYFIYKEACDVPSLASFVLAFSVAMAPAFLVGALVQAAADFHRKAAAGSARPRHALLMILLMAISTGIGLWFSQLPGYWQEFARDFLLGVALTVIIVGYLASARRGPKDQKQETADPTSE